jgi:hypothetical protein
VLEAIQAILCPERGAVSPKETPEPEPASNEEIVDFLQWLSQNRLEVRGLEGFDDPKFQRLLERLAPRFSNRLPNIAARFISDVMKRPGPKGLRPPGGGAGGQGRRSPETPKAGPATPPAVKARGSRHAPTRRSRELAKKRRS